MNDIHCGAHGRCCEAQLRHRIGFLHLRWSVRFNGDAIMALIKAQNAARKRYEWNVTEPDVHSNGITAWIAYVNQGASPTPPAP